MGRTRGDESVRNPDLGGSCLAACLDIPSPPLMEPAGRLRPAAPGIGVPFACPFVAGGIFEFVWELGAERAMDRRRM